MRIPTSPNILFIDAYDSFSHSIVGLIEETLHASVHVIRIDHGRTVEDLTGIIGSFDAVVVGPGPGNPANDLDVGLSRFLWTLGESDLIPVLGICLGFQSMGIAFGAQVVPLREARHGYVCNVTHKDSDIFKDVGELFATQYHSLQITLQSQCDEANLEECTATSSIQPLAYTDDTTNGHVLMALKVRDRPFWGIQFHPESICTSENAKRLISNWWELSRTWLGETRGNEGLSRLANPASHSDMRSITPIPDDLFSRIRAACPLLFPAESPSISYQVVSSVDMTVLDLIERLNLYSDEIFLLDSQTHSSGRYSIIGIPQSGKRTDFTFSAARSILTLATGTTDRSTVIDFPVKSQKDFWEVIRKVLTATIVDTSQGPIETPFWGGFIGYVSYEAGLNTLAIDKCRDDTTPHDISFTWIAKSVIVDHKENHIYIQHLGQDVMSWVGSTAQHINTFAQDRLIRPLRKVPYGCAAISDRTIHKSFENAIVEKPVSKSYCQKVASCKGYLAAGESYELCLTDQTHIYLPLSSEINDLAQEWVLYKQLRAVNPAPFGAFFRTNRITVVGSSPERFLCWSRSGRCQFRPIKGTVKKCSKVDLEAAKRHLSSRKERAENLMIVDLIRHDLSGIVGSTNCTVPHLMQVEEYETVYQLVSVIEGQISKNEPAESNGSTQQDSSWGSPSGIDILSAALPPGSMTGAPKKRSCELLMQLEDRPRGIYSGVLGYIDVGGGGDFSVVIRTAVKQRGEVVYKTSTSATSSCPLPHQVWRIGAGGAVTIQSTESGEFEEMEMKLDSVLRAFSPGGTETQCAYTDLPNG